MHATLMSETEVAESPTSDQEIEAYLTPDIRDQISAMDTPKAHCVGKMNLLNSIFKEVLSLTCSYRIELGTTLQRLVESYTSIFIQLLKISYESKKGQKESSYE